MATQPPPRLHETMIARIKRILLTPKEEWPVIDAEPATANGVFTSWVVPLAAIGPVSGLIGSLVFGYGALGIVYRPSVTTAVVGAVIGYLVALAGVYLLSLIIDALAPSFGGVKNKTAAMKVAAYGSTASFLAGVFQIIPTLAFLGLVGLYSFYLIYLGLPVLMKVIADKAMAYVAVVVVAAVVVYLVVGAVTGAIVGAVAMRNVSYSADAGTVSGRLSVPGVGTVDMGKLEQASQQIDAATKRMEAAQASGATGTAATGAVAPATLETLLPASIGGWQRTAVSSEAVGNAGVGGSHATGTYTSGDNRFELQVVDMAALGALSSLAGAVDIEHNERTADGYERTGQVDGRLTTEEWNTARHQGKFMQIVANRFTVQAEGTAPAIDDLKAAVASVDAGRLTALAAQS